MELNPEVKAALKELPVGARVPAYALKKIGEKIKQIYDNQKKQTDASHQSFIKRFKKVEDKASEIIGGRALETSDLSNIQQFFTEEEIKSLQSHLKSPQPIENYWLVAFKNSFYKNLLNKTDEQMLKHLKNIQSVVKTESFQIILTFNQCQWIEAGRYSRSLPINTNGIPSSYEGDQIKFKKALTEEQKGFIYDIGTNKKQVQDAVKMLEPLSFITNELVPFSLSYYLGEIDEDEDDDEDDEDGEQFEEDEEDQEQEPEKRVKKE